MLPILMKIGNIWHEAKKWGRCFGVNWFLQSRFDELVQTHHQLKQWENVPASYLAPGLHPFYIEQHQTRASFSS
jgi:TatD DNase family protein